MNKFVDGKKQNVASPLAAWAKRRSLLARLSALDDRMLEDIGYQRYQLADVAELAFPRADLKAYVMSLMTPIRAYLKAIKSTRQLAALDDRMLADIGLSRSEIPGAIRGDLAFRAFAMPNIMSVSKVELVHSIPDLISTPAPVNDDERPIAA